MKKKKKRIDRREKPSSKAVKSPNQSAEVSDATASERDFKPIRIRGEPLSVTVLRERR
jgi:hypothetical protein